MSKHKLAARRIEGRACRFVPFRVSVRPGTTRRGPRHFSRRPLSFLFKRCLKAQIFEVILLTPVNTANADRTPLSIRFAAHHRQPVTRPCLSLGLTRSSIQAAAVSCRFMRLRSKRNVTQRDTTRHNVTRSRLTFERRAYVLINSTVFSGVDLGSKRERTQLSRPKDPLGTVYKDVFTAFIVFARLTSIGKRVC